MVFSDDCRGGTSRWEEEIAGSRELNYMIWIRKATSALTTERLQYLSELLVSLWIERQLPGSSNGEEMVKNAILPQS
jgi:hypothetical protein